MLRAHAARLVLCAVGVLAACGPACAPAVAPPPRVELAADQKPRGRKLEDDERDGSRLVRKTRVVAGVHVVREGLHDRVLDTDCRPVEQSRVAGTSKWACVPNDYVSLGRETPGWFADAECRMPAMHVSPTTSAGWVVATTTRCSALQRVFRIVERRQEKTTYVSDGTRCQRSTYAPEDKVVVALEEVPPDGLVRFFEEDVPIDEELSSRWLVSPDGARLFDSFALRRHGDEPCTAEASMNDAVRCLPSSSGFRPDGETSGSDLTDYADSECKEPLVTLFDACGPDRFYRDEKGCAAEEFFRLEPAAAAYRREPANSSDDGLGEPECRNHWEGGGESGNERFREEERASLRGVAAAVPLRDFPFLKVVDVPLGDGRIVERRVARGGVTLHYDFWDRALLQSCSPAIAEDGIERWLAGTSYVSDFADAACTTAVARTLCNDPEGARFALVPKASCATEKGCPKEMHELADEVPTTALWMKTSAGKCTKATPDAAWSPWRYRKIGAKVAPASLAPVAAPTTRPVSAGAAQAAKPSPRR